MYGKFGTTIAAAGGSTSLAYTGVSVLWQVVAAVTLLAAGFATLRLVPRSQR